MTGHYAHRFQGYQRQTSFCRMIFLPKSTARIICCFLACTLTSLSRETFLADSKGSSQSYNCVPTNHEIRIHVDFLDPHPSQSWNNSRRDCDQWHQDYFLFPSMLLQKGLTALFNSPIHEAESLVLHSSGGARKTKSHSLPSCHGRR